MANGADPPGNFLNDQGQFVPISQLFERERVEHNVDHDRERIVAAETARRLEREVEETARRLERLVDETAGRLEQGVSKALEAVSATAMVHAEAHNREHQAHERIHAVEKSQVDKAERQRHEESQRLAADLKEYKASANEWRATVSDQSARFVGRDLFDQRTASVDTRLGTLERNIVGREGFNVALEARDRQIAALESFRSKALGFGALISLLSGVAGALLLRAFS